MNRANPLLNQRILYWLSAIALALTGFVSLTACGHPATGPAKPSPSTSPLGALVSPLTVQSPLATASPTRPPLSRLQLTVLHTNDTWGYLLPCG